MELSLHTRAVGVARWASFKSMASTTRRRLLPHFKMSAIRILLAMVACHDWEAEHLDVVTAFLEAPVEEKIHMMLPDGFKKLRLQWWRARVMAK